MKKSESSNNKGDNDGGENSATTGQPADDSKLLETTVDDIAATAREQAVDAANVDTAEAAAVGAPENTDTEEAAEKTTEAADVAETPEATGAAEATNTTEAAAETGDAADTGKSADTPESAETAESSDSTNVAAAGLTAASVSADADQQPADADKDAQSDDAASPPPPEAQPKRRRPWFSLFNLLLILVLVGCAIYYVWWQRQLATEQGVEIGVLRDEIAQRLETSSLASSLQPLRGQIGELDSRIARLNEGQQELQESSLKLFDLYGRNKNDWQLAEVEYLMRVAQHQLILTHDFEGAATTLQAANDRLAGLADPGLLPVRVTISDEIAELKTRKRPDLVGMTLILAQLSRQVGVLKPGFKPLTDPGAGSDTAASADTGADADTATDTAPAPESSMIAIQDWLQRFSRFVDSLIEVRYEPDRPPTLAEANVVEAGETLADTLKLARWSVLERDARQYDRLIAEAIRLTRSFYDLDSAANFDFLNQLMELQKMQLNPDKPDITGSMLQLQQIISQRKNAPTEPVDG